MREYRESGIYPMMDAIPIAVPVSALGIPASLITEKITPYNIIPTALGTNV